MGWQDTETPGVGRKSDHVWIPPSEVWPLMQIEPAIRKSVVFLGYRDTQNQVQLRASAFKVTYPPDGLGDRTTGSPPEMHSAAMYGQHRYGYLITAGHVIRRIHEKARDQKVVIRANKLGGSRSETLAVPTSEWISMVPLDGPLTYDADRLVKDVAVLRFDQGFSGGTAKGGLDLLDFPLEGGAF